MLGCPLRGDTPTVLCPLRGDTQTVLCPLRGDTQTVLCPRAGMSVKGRHASENTGNFDSGQNKTKACSYILKDRECNSLFVTMDTICIFLSILSYLSRSLADRWGTTVDFTTSFLHSSRFSVFRSMICRSRPVHSLMLSSHRFLCLPLRLPP